MPILLSACEKVSHKFAPMPDFYSRSGRNQWESD
nr:MAG TPA: hypothetical protein [Caudoviricetes sp.]